MNLNLSLIATRKRLYQFAYPVSVTGAGVEPANIPYVLRENELALCRYYSINQTRQTGNRRFCWKQSFLRQLHRWLLHGP